MEHVQRTLGPYKLLSELGHGASGIVYLARREGAAQPVALKVGLERQGEGLIRFMAEAEIAGKLNHPGLVRVVDVGQYDGMLTYAMEYCPGPNLQQRLRRGPMHPQEAVDLARDLAAALEHAHAQGVVHRDLKPANIILDERSGRARVTDFGLARDDTLVRLTQTNQLLGTPHYMAPEQILDAKHADARADVYGLGGILYVCLTGRTPYPSHTAAELLWLKHEKDPESPDRLEPSVPAALAKVCMKALARQPEDRYPSAAAFAEALDAVFPPAGAGAAEEVPGGWARWRWGLAGALALALAVALVGLGWALGRRQAPATAASPPRPAVSVPAPETSEASAAVPAGPGHAALEQGLKDLEDGDYAGAEVQLTQALEADPELLQAWLGRGQARLLLDDTDGARKDLDRALELAPDSVTVHAERALLHLLEGDAKAALADYERVSQLQPDDADAAYGVAICRDALGDTAGAEEAYGKAIELDPELSDAWFQRARLRHSGGDLEAARADYDHFLELKPDSAEGLSWRGQLYIDTQHYRKAEADLARAVEVWPEGVRGKEGVQRSLEQLRLKLEQE